MEQLRHQVPFWISVGAANHSCPFEHRQRYLLFTDVNVGEINWPPLDAAKFCMVSTLCLRLLEPISAGLHVGHQVPLLIFAGIASLILSLLLDLRISLLP